MSTKGIKAVRKHFVGYSGPTTTRWDCKFYCYQSNPHNDKHPFLIPKGTKLQIDVTSPNFIRFKTSYNGIEGFVNVDDVTKPISAPFIIKTRDLVSRGTFTSIRYYNQNVKCYKFNTALDYAKSVIAGLRDCDLNLETKNPLIQFFQNPSAPIIWGAGVDESEMLVVSEVLGELAPGYILLLNPELLDVKGIYVPHAGNMPIVDFIVEKTDGTFSGVSCKAAKHKVGGVPSLAVLIRASSMNPAKDTKIGKLVHYIQSHGGNTKNAFYHYVLNEFFGETKSKTEIAFITKSVMDQNPPPIIARIIDHIKATEPDTQMAKRLPGTTTYWVSKRIIDDLKSCERSLVLLNKMVESISVYSCYLNYQDLWKGFPTFKFEQNNSLNLKWNSTSTIDNPTMNLAVKFQLKSNDSVSFTIRCSDSRQLPDPSAITARQEKEVHSRRYSNSDVDSQQSNSLLQFC